MRSLLAACFRVVDSGSQIHRWTFGLPSARRRVVLPKILLLVSRRGVRRGAPTISATTWWRATPRSVRHTAGKRWTWRVSLQGPSSRIASSWKPAGPNRGRATTAQNQVGILLRCHQKSWPLPGAIDLIAYSSRLLAARPGVKPNLAVADEEHAYRNWAVECPDAMIMVVILRRTLRAWRDFALCFGDKGAVYAYNWVRVMISIFFLVEFALPVWPYYDDSAIMDIAELATASWWIFLKFHALLNIPVKGNPLSLSGGTPRGGERIFQPPAPQNIYLGERVRVGAMPCGAGPTDLRIKSIVALVDTIEANGVFPPSEASSVFGTTRFAGSELHGRVGLPALQPICKRQHEQCSQITPALVSSFRLLRDVLFEVGERTWPDLSAPPPSIQVLGECW